MSYIRILWLEYLWTLLPTRNTYRQSFINYHSRFFSPARNRSPTHESFSPNSGHCTDVTPTSVFEMQLTTLVPRLTTTFTCKQVQIHKTLTKSALLLSCATIYTTIIMDRKRVISGRPNSCIAATFVYYRGQVLYGMMRPAGGFHPPSVLQVMFHN